MVERHALEEQKKKLEGDKATLEGEKREGGAREEDVEGELTAERQKDIGCIHRQAAAEGSNRGGAAEIKGSTCR